MHIVTGSPRAGKSAFITRLCAQRHDWLGLINAPVPAAGGPNLKQLSTGCPCCTGKVVLQVTLARALRATRAGRVFVERCDLGHLERLKRALREAPLGQSVVGSCSIRLPRDAGLQAADIDQ